MLFLSVPLSVVCCLSSSCSSCTHSSCVVFLRGEFLVVPCSAGARRRRMAGTEHALHTDGNKLWRHFSRDGQVSRRVDAGTVSNLLCLSLSLSGCVCLSFFCCALSLASMFVGCFSLRVIPRVREPPLCSLCLLLLSYDAHSHGAPARCSPML